MTYGDGLLQFFPLNIPTKFWIKGETMNSLDVVQQVIVLAILMSVGFCASKKNIITSELSNGLSRILVNLALPAMIIMAFSFEFSIDMLHKAGAIAFFSICIHIIIIIISRMAFSKYDIDKKNVLNFQGVFPNAGFMGLPLIYSLYGQIGVFYASIFMVPYHILMWTYGQGLFLKSKQRNKKIAISKQFRNPAILAVIIGLSIFVLKIHIPYVIETPLGMLAGITSPLAMIIVGEKIAQIRFKDIFSDLDVYYGSFMRLIIAPLITFVLVKQFDIDPLIKQVCIAIEAIPAAITVVILPEKNNGDTVFASKCIIVGHILCIITIPIMILALN